jgi:hypothetical protein
MNKRAIHTNRVKCLFIILITCLSVDQLETCLFARNRSVCSKPACLSETRLFARNPPITPKPGCLPETRLFTRNPVVRPKLAYLPETRLFARNPPVNLLNILLSGRLLACLLI